MPTDFMEDDELRELLEIPEESEYEEGNDDVPQFGALQFGRETEIGMDLIETLAETGYDPEELIPGLILAAMTLADRAKDPNGCIDDMIDLLTEGFPGEEQ